MRSDRTRPIVVLEYLPTPARRHLGLIFCLRSTNLFYIVTESPSGVISFEQVRTI